MSVHEFATLSMNGFDGESHPVFGLRFLFETIYRCVTGLRIFWMHISIYIYIILYVYIYIYCMHTCFYMSVGSARYIPLLMVKIWGKIRWTPQKHHGIYRKKQNYPKLHVLPISLKGDDPWCHNSPGDGEQCSPSLLLLGRRQCSSGQPLWPGELEWEVWSCGACSFFCHARSFFICSFVFLL